jgi:hypothetical protein
MNTLQKAIHLFVTCLSVTLSLGVLAHDAHAEQVYATVQSTTGNTGAYTEAEQQIPQRPLDEMRAQHTHVDYNPLGSTLANSFTYQSPSIAPRKDSHHGHLLRTLEEGGRHAFDNANLPIIF